MKKIEGSKSQQKLNNKGFEKPELIVIIAVLAVIIIFGIIIGSIIKNNKKDNKGIVTITYNSNGGTGSMKNTECKNGSKCILKNNTYKKEGYSFAGWTKTEDSDTVDFKINDVYNANQDITLYAIWEKKEITITFDPNGGTGEMKKETYIYGNDDISIPDNTFEKKGYTFSGWNIYSPTIDRWYGCTDKKTCESKDENQTLGWYAREKIVTYYNPKNKWETTNSEHDITYYAQWGENTYQIKYELNGGMIGKDSPTSGVYESTITISNPTKEGFKFNGWSIDVTDAKINGNELTIGSSDVTLTAKWVATAADYIQYIYNDSTLRNNNSLIKDNTSDKNIRYAGSNPKNYVLFNDELWRIIGVFNVSNGTSVSKRLKLVRNDSLINASFDSSSKQINNGKGISDWRESDAKKILNDYYVGKSTSCKYCKGEGQSTCSNNCSNSINKLSNDAKNMIEDAIWYLGGVQFGGNDGKEKTTALEAYQNERKSNTINNCISPSDGNCTDKISRSSKWTGKIALIYTSDYGYASEDSSCQNDITYNQACSKNNWLNSGESYWTLTPRDSTYFGNAGWYILTPKYEGKESTYNICGDNVVSADWGIRPSVYLKSTVTILSGEGTSSNPYKLGI